MFEMILFLDPVSVNPFLVERMGSKSNDVVLIIILHHLKQYDADFGRLVKTYIILLFSLV